MKKNLFAVVVAVFVVLNLANAQDYQDKFIKYSTPKLSKEQLVTVRNGIKGVDYDEKEAMVLTKITEWQYHIDTVGVTYHRVGNTFSYARMLLNTQEDKYIDRACKAILASIALQDVNPKSKTYGLWPYFKEEPLATKRTPPDFNMADFFSVTLLDIYMGHKQRLPDSVVSKIVASLKLASRCIQKRDQGPSYTNIAIMGTYVTYMVSHLFNMPDMQDYAAKRLKIFYDYTIEKQGFTEFNSPTYTLTALDEISRMKQHIVEPDAKAMVDKINDVAWNIIARHFHKPTGQWAGPNSRSYSTLLKQEKLFTILNLASKGKVGLVEKKYDANEILLEYEMPEKYVPYFNSPVYPRMESDVFEPNEPKVTGTTLLEKDFVLSTANRSCLWNQRRPFLAYWGTSESPRYLQFQFLHNNYDFSSAAIFTQQENTDILAGVNLFLFGGDKHIGLDKIKTGKFKAKDLRLRFRFGGTKSSDVLSIPTKENEPFQFKIDDLSFQIHLFQASYDKQKGYWEKGGDGKDAWIDYVLYAGAEKEIDLNAVQEAVWAFTFSMGKKGQKLPTSKPEFDIIDKTFHAKWNNLKIDFPTNLLLLGGFPKNL